MRKGDFGELLNTSNPFFNRVGRVPNPYNSNAPFPNPKYNDFSGFNPLYYDHKNVAVVDRRTGYITSVDPSNGIVTPGSGIPDSAEGRANASQRVAQLGIPLLSL